ncbi:MAG: hypothetical protein HRU19_02790 [Pseudobacteriovorax sp.]|nr:hypothetical protein [Pseudobacteriovorax sp.]
MKSTFGYLLLISLSMPAYSQNSDGGDTAEAKQGNSSEIIRQTKRISVGFEAGSFLSPVIGLGVTGGYMVTDSLRLGASYASGTWDATEVLDDSDPDVFINRFDVNASIAEVEVKWFTGNSFYLGLGLGQRVITFDAGAQDRNLGLTLETEITLPPWLPIWKLATSGLWILDSIWGDNG